MKDVKGLAAYTLKKVVLRIDIKAYEGYIVEADIDDVIRNIRGDVDSFEITRNIDNYTVSKINDFQSDVFSDNTDFVEDVAYRYRLRKDELTILLSMDFIILVIESADKYQGFWHYYKYASLVISQYTAIKGISIRVQRIGLRKINFVFVDNLESIESLFNTELFGFASEKQFLFPDSTPKFSAIKKISVENSNSICNIITAAQPGLIYYDSVYPKDIVRVLLDVDSIMNITNNHHCDFDSKEIDNTISKLNVHICHVFLESLTDDFYTALRNNDQSFFSQNNVIGVTEK